MGSNQTDLSFILNPLLTSCVTLNKVMQLLVQVFPFMKWDCYKIWDNTCKIHWKGSVMLALIIKSRNRPNLLEIVKPFSKWMRVFVFFLLFFLLCYRSHRCYNQGCPKGPICRIQDENEARYCVYSWWSRQGNCRFFAPHISKT